MTNEYQIGKEIKELQIEVVGLKQALQYYGGVIDHNIKEGDLKEPKVKK